MGHNKKTIYEGWTYIWAYTHNAFRIVIMFFGLHYFNNITFDSTLFDTKSREDTKLHHIYMVLNGYFPQSIYRLMWLAQLTSLFI